MVDEREYFANMAKRPSMYVYGGRLAGVEAFLEGYDQHARRHGGPGLQGWREWLVARRGADCSHGWQGQVRHIALPGGWQSWELPEDDERHVLKVLFVLLDEFLGDRPAPFPGGSGS